MGAALRLLVTQSGHSLDYGVQKVCVPKTNDLHNRTGRPTASRMAPTPACARVRTLLRGSRRDTRQPSNETAGRRATGPGFQLGAGRVSPPPIERLFLEEGQSYHCDCRAGRHR